ncbi:hypothetical protein RRG08_050938 [Elysia crispata]|uniref:Uncharacterized protein n=1 Tax=Elysia crispata TaxID=231223 RepID=A0AAE0YQ70_9GAST|nr:hypothetical protein RRG08_050938 [Elysia crispata]
MSDRLGSVIRSAPLWACGVKVIRPNSILFSRFLFATVTFIRVKNLESHFISLTVISESTLRPFKLGLNDQD